MSDFDEIMNKPAFASLTGEQKVFYKQMMERLQGKSAIEAMKIIMESGGEAPQGVPIGEKERDLMLEAVMESLPPKDKDSFAKIMKLMRLASVLSE